MRCPICCVQITLRKTFESRTWIGESDGNDLSSCRRDPTFEWGDIASLGVAQCVDWAKFTKTRARTSVSSRVSRVICPVWKQNEVRGMYGETIVFSFGRDGGSHRVLGLFEIPSITS